MMHTLPGSQLPKCLLKSWLRPLRRPFRAVFTLGNRKKSAGLRSGLYGGCDKVGTPIRVRYDVTWKAVWLEALSWWSFHRSAISGRLKFSVTMLCTVDLRMLSSSAINRTLNRRSESKSSFTFDTFSSEELVEGRPDRSLSSTVSRPSLKSLCQRKTWAFDMAFSP